MKDFFKKLGRAVIDWTLRVFDNAVAGLCRIPVDKYLHFVAGTIIALPFAFLCPQGCRFLCLIPVIFAGLFKEALGLWRSKSFDWFDVLATISGGLTVALFSFIPSIG